MKAFGFIRSETARRPSRDFPPFFFHRLLGSLKCEIFLEEGYGENLGFSRIDYLSSKQIRFVTRQDALRNSDYVVTLISPDLSEIEQLTDSQILFSMLHYPTHSDRVRRCLDRGINAISLDGLLDHQNRRIIQDFDRLASNAMTATFLALKEYLPAFYWFDRNRKPISVYLFGCGGVGREIITAALRMGNSGLQQELLEKGGNPLVEVIPSVSIHSRLNELDKRIISRPIEEGGFPHVIVDASARADLSKPVVNRDHLCRLPLNSILVDVSADDYGDGVTKGIEGMPTGDESQSIFEPGDRAWHALVPRQWHIPEDCRRVALSNYAWPNWGTNTSRLENMTIYGHQLLPILLFIGSSRSPIERPTRGTEWSLNAAIWNATPTGFKEEQQKEI